MDFNIYQELSRKTAIYPNKDDNYIYPTLGLCGESGEVAEKIKKILRDNNGIISEEKRIELINELGDVLWYLSNLCVELNINLNSVAEYNLNKLNSRKERGKLRGSGDNR